MLGIIEGSLECSSPGTFEWYYEVVKELHLLRFKDNIKGDNKLWNTVAYTESVSYVIRVDSSNWKSEVIQLGISDDEKLVLSDNIIHGIANNS